MRKEETNVDELTRMMVGRDVNLSRRERKEFTDLPNLLELKNVSYTVNKTVKKLDGINLQLKAGEVLGIAGVDGNGQEELVQAICGQITPDSGEILFKGDNIVKKDIRARKDSGIALVPEDRHRDGLVLQYSVADNLVLGMHYQEPYAHGRTWMDYKAIPPKTARPCRTISTSGVPTWTCPRALCPAATSRRSSLPERPAATRTCSSQCSPPVV